MLDDLDLPPLRAEWLRAGLVQPNGPYAALDVVAETGSTNHDLKQRSECPDRTVLVAEHQTAGRGRAGRQWLAPPRSGLFFSVLLRPAGVPVSRWGWLPLVAGLGLATAVDRVTGVTARLKWPNDLLLGRRQRKGAGILAEAVGPALIVGVGLNVSLREVELPVPEATSLALEGARNTDRDTLLRAVLRELAKVEEQWRAAGGDAQAGGLAQRYRELCATVGQVVRVELPSGGPVFGTAVDVDGDGRLVVRDDDGAEHAVSAGDVVHVRPATS
jgi:BirA family biotin operon repressor/biotin-[acetyl-CoA-carboxylase] ligase